MRGKLIGSILLCASAALAQQYEIGADIGYGWYRSGTVFGSGTQVDAGIRNRFAAGAVIGEDLYQHLAGEIRYTYQDGHAFVQAPGVKTDIQSESHAITYDMLFHFKDRESRFRPFLAAGAGIKGYVVTGPEPSPQPLPGVVSLVNHDVWTFVASLGGGVKYVIHRHVIVRVDFRDYLTKFPKNQILPAPNNTARGIFQQFTPMFGVSYWF